MRAADHARGPICDRSVWWFAAALIVLMLGLFVGPRIADDQQVKHCVVNVHLPGPFGISLNCDSPEFMRLAQHPDALLEPLNTRQSRPGLIAAAALLSWALSPLQSLADTLGIRARRHDIAPQRIANALAEDIPAYVAYIILNFATILAAFYLLRRICAPWSDDGTAALVILTAVGFLLTTNDVVKTFMWSPHTELFNILVPVFALYASMRANAGALLEHRFAIWIGIITGLGGTAYPLFVIVLPCVAVCGLLFAATDGTRKTWIGSAVNFILLSVLSLAPEALWAGFVLLKTGAFYQHEMVRYNEVTWMLDAWHRSAGTLAAIWWDKFEHLLQFAALQAIPLLTVLLVVAALTIKKRSADHDASRSLWSLVLTALLVDAVTAVFYTCVGLIVPRLAYALIPALIVVAAATALLVAMHDRRRRKILAYCCVGVALIAVSATVVRGVQ